MGSPNVKTGYKLIDNARYPTVDDDYKRGFLTLKSLPYDLFLGAHGSHYNLEAKFNRVRQGAANSFLDQAGFLAYVLYREQASLDELAKQSKNQHKWPLSK